MKIVYSHLLNHLDKKPTINELSDLLFQLGHEHEIEGEILDMEITPNRGDCLSLKGLARDLNYFYGTREMPCSEIDLEPLKLQFENKAKDLCPNISFMEIEIENIPKKYEPYLESYFSDLNINKNNFFTDISNYLAYETGQPTHCFDDQLMKGHFSLEKKKLKQKFKTLLGTEIELSGENLIFSLDQEVISLAGTMGGASTACSNTTKKVLVECAYFKPEEILGKARDYNLNSEAAYKFERGVDFLSQEKVLRRFLKIVDDHTKIKSAAFYTEQNKTDLNKVNYDYSKLNAVIGVNLSEEEQLEYLSSLGFIPGSEMQIPSHRSDVDQMNDLAEEITRMVGYNNIPSQALTIPVMAKKQNKNFEDLCRTFLVNNGFFEVINNPFTDFEGKNAILVDNPLDKQRSLMRTCLMNSLRANIAYNQNRQKDSIKFFECSDIYKTTGFERRFAMAATGRVNKNAMEFNSQLDYSYLKGIILSIFSDLLKASIDFKFKEKRGYDFYESVNLNGVEIGGLGKINKDTIDSKVNTPVFACEIIIDNLEFPAKKLSDVSDFPASYRDLSFSLSNISNIKDISEIISKFENDELLKESFIFDFYQNKKLNLLKVGFRFKFQAQNRSLKENEIDSIIKEIIELAMSIQGVNIEGL